MYQQSIGVPIGADGTPDQDKLAGVQRDETLQTSDLEGLQRLLGNQPAGDGSP